MNLKKKFPLFLFFISFHLHAMTILIDPGHGGDDYGAQTKIGKKPFYEKNLTLELSKRIYENLKKKKFDVYLTRSIDRSVSLEERSGLAEKIKADLFVSIHMNASKINNARGFETYYLDNHNSKAVKKVEEVENKSLQGEDLMVNQILAGLVIEQTVPRSKALATEIHTRLSRYMKSEFGVPNRGIKPALFYVLALSKRPSVLLEVGFLSNEKELKKLNSEDFQAAYSEAVALGIEAYIKAQK